MLSRPAAVATPTNCATGAAARKAKLIRDTPSGRRAGGSTSPTRLSATGGQRRRRNLARRVRRETNRDCQQPRERRSPPPWRQGRIEGRRAARYGRTPWRPSSAASRQAQPSSATARGSGDCRTALPPSSINQASGSVRTSRAAILLGSTSLNSASSALPVSMGFDGVTARRRHLLYQGGSAMIHGR